MSEMFDTIWKYEFPVTDAWVVPMPAGTRILPQVACLVPGVLTVWAEVTVPKDGAEPEMENRRIYVIGTGNPRHVDLGDYLGTAFDRGFFWHVYDDYIGEAEDDDELYE